MPVILATQEAEIRKILVEVSLGNIVRDILSWENLSQNVVDGMGQSVGPEFKPVLQKQNKTKIK
jgi:hypothetical protein